LFFSINPSEIFFESSGKTTNAKIINFGYINEPSCREPYNIKISSFFSDNYYTFKNNTNFTARDSIDYLEKIFLSRASIVFSISGNIKPKSMNVFIESFSFGEVAMENGDIFFTIVLKEHIKTIIETSYIFSYDNTPPISSNHKSQDYRYYTVKKNDNLWNLSRKYLGAGNRYLEIARLNNIPNPRLIYIGQVIKIPW